MNGSFNEKSLGQKAVVFYSTQYFSMNMLHFRIKKTHPYNDTQVATDHSHPFINANKNVKVGCVFIQLDVNTWLNCSSSIVNLAHPVDGLPVG